MMSRYGIKIQPANITGPINVYRGDQLVGTVPGYPVTSTSFIYDVRSYDFTPQDRDGETVLILHPSVSPGDLRCVAGFREPNGHEPGKGEVAEMFDTLVAAANARAKGSR